MPPTISWSDLAGLRVAVWGLGVEGRANLRKLDALGLPVVARVDDRPADEGVLATAEGGLEALAGCDVVVKSPGISRYREDLQALEAGGVPVVGGLGLWLAGADRDRVVCITGTKGKSTTTAIAGHLVAGLGQRALMGGNFGIAPWDPDAPQDVDWWVIETSSYQATDVAVGPAVVAVTSLSQDHLDWHRGPEGYFRDKLSLCRAPGVRAVVAEDGAALRARSADLGPAVRWISADGDVSWTAGLGLLGDHNVRNALVARAALVELGVPGADDDARIAEAAEGFAGLGSRLRKIGSVSGVDFVDDSLSTNVLPTLAAVDAFRGRRVALLVGGHDRGIDYAPLAAGLAGRDGLAVFCMPDSGPRIAAALWDGAPDLDVRECAGLPEATRAGFEWADGDGVVLLSPAAPSFGQYRDYADRSADFVATVEQLASS
ncbi:UDP-N-acetylmuramoylalanine--D-glutamate ligase [Modestobacter sp. DSM 44400]|uniref:UDP-N-acetylmuramoyl-L-alanine--D-glutamate ligase n=1 Tax=Modestobacter sp. DSM 44400 TaxID=1550230 RepID=UPI00089C0DC9|nr:UDP-N-acetylmuramoyl-L-alanine--D-glutamate ligase [Modestobacter sp. DSM 44400]SDX80721.1 UDP-N-acetylmuramoylalanine--D-glutamate ligase [Modestobacter sp. DSM 44400]